MAQVTAASPPETVRVGTQRKHRCWRGCAALCCACRAAAWPGVPTAARGSTDAGTRRLRAARWPSATPSKRSTTPRENPEIKVVAAATRTHPFSLTPRAETSRSRSTQSTRRTTTSASGGRRSASATLFCGASASRAFSTRSLRTSRFVCCTACTNARIFVLPPHLGAHVHHAHHLPLFSLLLASHILFSRCPPPAQIRMDVQSGRTVGKDTEYM